MSLTKCEVVTDNIQNLPNSPALSPDELKQTFDKTGKDLKDYINDFIIFILSSAGGSIVAL